MAENTYYRPWGSYTILEEGLNYKVKRIHVNPHSRLSLQLHRHRNEHWVVVSGTAVITNGDRIFDASPNASVYIPAQTIHRLENRGEIPVELIEVQYGDYLGEDDIVRLDDDYKRHEP
jgi:mannose-6-phosphate isomerase-like protein (cupin superfamily)